MKKRILLALVLLTVMIDIIGLLHPWYGENNGQSDNGWFSDQKITSWVGRTNTTFTGGYGECVSGDGKYIYILQEKTATSTPNFVRYNPVNNSWNSLSVPPSVSFKNGVAMAYDYNGNFYVLTGSSYSDGANRVEFYRYNISTDTWIRLADSPHVQGAGDAIVYSGYDNRIYAFLGRAHYTGSYKPDVQGIFTRYDPTTDRWTNLSYPPWPGTDDGSSLVWTGGKYIYALQGEYYENKPLRSFARYDITTDSWQVMSDIPAKDGVGDGGSLLWIGYYDQNYTNIIFALDGNGCNETPGYNFSVYYINKDTWQREDNIPSPIGYYVGNRLAYASGKIWYWQGTPSTWKDGTGVYSYTYTAVQVPELDSRITALFSVILAALIFREQI